MRGKKYIHRDNIGVSAFKGVCGHQASRSDDIVGDKWVKHSVDIPCGCRKKLAQTDLNITRFSKKNNTRFENHSKQHIWNIASGIAEGVIELIRQDCRGIKMAGFGLLVIIL